MNEWQKWMLGIAAALIIAATIATVTAIWRLIASRASKPDLAKIVEAFDAQIKLVNIRVDAFAVSFGSVVSKTDLMKDLGTQSTRADDKELRVQRDITELKGDLKALIEKVVGVDKRLDELPARVASLEATRNQDQDHSKS